MLKHINALTKQCEIQALSRFYINDDQLIFNLLFFFKVNYLGILHQTCLKHLQQNNQL